MMKGIIDRFEGNYAMVEMHEGTIEYIFKNILPTEVDVGDIITIHTDHHISLDVEGTAKRRKEIDTLADELFEEE
ncbi:MAG: DUF3006 domain-containing protein [Kurthia sp.]|nr:DUF3006 domain-containing protein [Candidatus Kurthia equi]